VYLSLKDTFSTLVLRVSCHITIQHH